MINKRLIGGGIAATLLALIALPAAAQSFQVQCPSSTITHPTAANNNSEPDYNGATTFTTGANGYQVPNATTVNGAIKCQQISGGDGFATMGDGTQIYMFSFGPLSGLADMANGKPGTQFPNVFNTLPPAPLVPGDPATSAGALDDPGYVQGDYANATKFGFNGAVGLAPDADCLADTSLGGCASTIPANGLDGHVDTRQIMDVGVLNGNQPAPLFAIDEDDEFFLTLTNVGQVMRPDLFEQHTVHFHGYPNASAFYDGVPDASVAINVGGSFTYYYLAPDAGTYFWHCHISPPEHLQMGMVGQLFVRPRQNRVPSGSSLYDALVAQQADKRTKCDAADVLCTNQLPAGADPGSALRAVSGKYAYNDGDGSTYYDVEVPLQIHGFDPNFHFVGMTFNPENFTDVKDKYFLLNGRSYPDTVTEGPIATQTPDGLMHYSQPISAIVSMTAGQKALLRISNLNITEYHTLASLGIPMKVIGVNAKLLRDQAGNNLYYTTNSITLGGGESLDVILDSTGIPKGTYYLYSANLDQLSNDAENFGGLMTEVRVN